MAIIPSVPWFLPLAPGFGRAIRPDHHPQGTFLLRHSLASCGLPRRAGGAQRVIEALGHQPFFQGPLAWTPPLATFACLQQIPVDSVVNPPSYWLTSGSGRPMQHRFPTMFHAAVLSVRFCRVWGISDTTSGASTVTNNERESYRDEILRNLVVLGFWPIGARQAAGRCIHGSAHSARRVSEL